MAFNASKTGTQTAHAACDCTVGPLFKRRRFMQAAGALGALSAVGALPGCASIGASGAAPKLIDTHHHFYPPEYNKARLAWEDAHKRPHNAEVAGWSVQSSLEELDKGGVKTGILSLASTPGVWFDQGAPAAAKMVRYCNEYGATMVRDHPGRFGLFAALAMIDVDASLKEIEYALDVLKADGIGLQTNYGDKWPGNPVYRPVFEELNRRKAVVYFHPLVAACCSRLSVGASPAVLEVPHDTTRAVASLLLSGTFARYRDIKWLFSHAGGTVPMLAGRMEYFFASRRDAKKIAPDGYEAEFRRLYYDTANALHPASMAALLKLVPESQVVFGTDYPYVPIDEQAASLRKLGLPEATVRRIESGNAMGLVPRLKA